MIPVVNDPITFNTAYYMEFKEKDPEMLGLTPLVAIRPTFFPPIHSVEWATNSGRGDYMIWDTTSIDFDSYAKKYTNNSSNLLIADGPDTPNEIVLVSGNETEKLVRLTVDVFNRCVRPHVVNGDSLQFRNDNEVQKFFLSTEFLKWR